MPALPPPRRLLGKLGLSLLTLLLLLGVGEGLARLLTDVRPPVLLRDPDLGRRFRPGFEGTVYDGESMRDVPLRFDREGFRGPDRPEDPGPGVRRVAVLGDSMVAATSVDEADTAACRLEALLAEARPADGWEVLNCGISGSSTGQELLAYRQVVRRYAPELVLLAFFTGNDLADNHRALTSNPRIYFDLDEDGALVQQSFSRVRASASRWLNLNSRLYVWNKRRKEASAAAGPPTAMDPGHWIFAADPPPHVARAWEITEALVAELAREVRADGAELVVVLVPCAQQVDRPLFERTAAFGSELGATLEVDHPSRELARICAAAGVELVDLAPAFRAALAETPDVSALYFQGVGHLTEAGNALVAEALAAALPTAR